MRTTITVAALVLSMLTGCDANADLCDRFARANTDCRAHRGGAIPDGYLDERRDTCEASRARDAERGCDAEVVVAVRCAIARDEARPICGVESCRPEIDALIACASRD